jgi:predicted PhzF superfamily epimerase YddE/YHI9
MIKGTKFEVLVFPKPKTLKEVDLERRHFAVMFGGMEDPA